MGLEVLHIGETKLMRITLKDKNKNLFVIAGLSFLEVEIYQHGELLETYNMIPDADPEVTYEGSVLIVELTKTLSPTLTPGNLVVRLRTNNPNAAFSDGGQHISIEPITVYKVEK